MPRHDHLVLRGPRRGSAYVFVLGVASMVTLLGLSALTVARLGAAGGQDSHDWHDAQTLAAAGIDHALETLDSYNDRITATWRTTVSTRGTSGNGGLDDGTFLWHLADVNGGANLFDYPTNDLLLTSTGMKGDARHVMSVRLSPTPGTTIPLPCLGSALHAGTLVRVLTATVTSDGTISSNGSMQSAGGNVDADVSVSDSVLGFNYIGSTNTGAAAMDLPDATLFGYYLTHGTALDVGTFGVVNADTFALEGRLLSPTVNPFGTPNASGIYVIDCAGANLKITGCRIVGTLVVLDPGPESEVYDSMNWEPAIVDYPAFLVRGSMRIALSSKPLDEPNAGVNFNPDGTPYDGASDNLSDDEYPTVIGGIVYASDDLWLDGATIEGAVIVGDVLTIETEPLTVLHRYTAVNPAHGFTMQLEDGYPEVVDGSWRQVVVAPTDG